jgi:hypothetical protein
MGIPLVFSAAFAIMTGVLSTICFVRNNFIIKDKAESLIFKCILSYVFGFDVIVAIIEFISMKKIVLMVMNQVLLKMTLNK